MDKIILCDFHLFDVYQKVYLVDPDGIREIANSDMENLGDAIAAVANKYHVTQVHLIGDPGTANTLIIPAIYAANETKYNNQIIEVEVN